MKKVILILLISTLTLFASTEIDKAYAKEFAFLKAQKNMLQKRLKEVKVQNSNKLVTAKKEIQKFQAEVLKKESISESLSNKLFAAQQNLESINDDTSLIEAVVLQGSSALKPYNITVKVDKENYPQSLKTVFDEMLVLIRKLSSLRVEDGSFYLKDGSKQEGKLIRVGNIATYGVSEKVSGALVPAGNMSFKIWGDKLSAQTAKALLAHEPIDTLHMFIYENVNQEIPDKEEKTLLDVINSGGIIGWVIVVLGAIGIMFLFMRIFSLLSSKGEKDLTQRTLNELKHNGIEKTLEFLKPKKGATARVLKATVRNLDRDREHIEDIITESIIHESIRLDKFSSTILVIAAVAPLLGLLGTVTGMIATFEIITEFGTGDPKLLSSGISIALVTTELGLIVAIPLLLAGNLLNSWAESIKDSMEHDALHMVNEYSKQK